ncbi:hypothetical protein [Burkholderia cenocepacia]|jgi:hypothetical protein|uniref:DUF5983 family protein n=1 Tax=Burkholderia cenocepacia TaxID=95486 RepID=UPI0024B6FD07|nr:hypothetical protein [Burkholderia cenocepacia]MDI9688517.1 hypothetical protein [Burkholderia cenocepacia]
MNQAPPSLAAAATAPVPSTPQTDAEAQPVSLRERVLAHAEPLVALSTAHLHPDNRQRLADGGLSVLTYPNEYGGFVYVGEAGENEPTEPELAAIFAAARGANIVWIKFDADAEVVDGLPTFDDPPWV